MSIQSTRIRAFALCLTCSFCTVACVCAIVAAAVGLASGQQPKRVKVAEGEYEIYQQANSGAVGPFGELIYNFHESWTLWRLENGEYQVEGIRRFESPRGNNQKNPFTADLSRDLTLNKVTEFSKLRWVPDSGPLSCEFLPNELHCSSGGSNPKQTINLQVPLEHPFGLLWPISPFSLSGIAQQMERDPNQATPIDLIRIQQPSAADPVATTILEGPLQYLGEAEIQAAGRTWKAHEFSLKVAMHPQYILWTSPKGLLLAITVQHQDKNWPQEGMRLARFTSFTDF